MTTSFCALAGMRSLKVAAPIRSARQQARFGIETNLAVTVPGLE
jgi:hypothetical protein